MDMDTGDSLTERIPMAKSTPSAISIRPDSTRRKLQKLPKSIAITNPVACLLPPARTYYSKIRGTSTN
jgi:hypothetical protein